MELAAGAAGSGGDLSLHIVADADGRLLLDELTERSDLFNEALDVSTTAATPVARHRAALAIARLLIEVSNTSTLLPSRHVNDSQHIALSTSMTEPALRWSRHVRTGAGNDRRGHDRFRCRTMTIVATHVPGETEQSALVVDKLVARRRGDADEFTETRPAPSASGSWDLAWGSRCSAVFLVVNGYGDLVGRSMAYAAAASSAIAGFGLLGMATERDRFGPPLMWISATVALSWGAMNWISPPFDSVVTVWSNDHQLALATLGIGNGLALAGVIALAFVRRPPNLTVAAILAATVALLASNTVLLRSEWTAIGFTAFAVGMVLLAWDQSPRTEPRFVIPEDAPRISRAALSLAALALCGTTIQLWSGRMSTPRSRPAIAAAIVLLAGAFATANGVRRELQRRETTLSEWRSWIREIRRNDFRAELENFQSAATTPAPAEAPRPLSFPDLLLAAAEETPAPAAQIAPAPVAPIELVPIELVPIELAPVAIAPAEVVIPAAEVLADPMPAATVAVEMVPLIPPPEPTRSPTLPRIVATVDTPTAVERARGTFAALAGLAVLPAVAAVPSPTGPSRTGGIDELAAWCSQTGGAPLLVAVEAMTLDRFDQLSRADQQTLRQAVEGLLREVMPSAQLLAWIDGPYYIVVLAEFSNTQIMALNKTLLERLQGTVELSDQRLALRGTLAFLRPSPPVTVDRVVDEAVTGLIRARQLELATLGVRS